MHWTVAYIGMTQSLMDRSCVDTLKIPTYNQLIKPWGSVMPNVIVEKLQQVREIIFNEQQWTQHSLARNAERKKTLPTDPEATCYCLIGAIVKVSHPDVDLERRLIECIHINSDFKVGNLSLYNDSHTHSEIISLLDITIRNEQRRYWQS